MSDCDFLLIATHAEKYAPKNEQGDNAIIDFSLKNSILVTLDQDQKKIINLRSIQIWCSVDPCFNV